MCNNYIPINPDNRATSVFFVIRILYKFIHDSLVFHDLVKGFSHLQNNVSRKSVRHNDICFVLKEVFSFDVANEVDLLIAQANVPTPQPAPLPWSA